MGSTITERTDHGDGWMFVRYSDGNEQWQYNGNIRFFAERVVADKSRRMRWVIVDRGPVESLLASRSDDRLYPPKALKGSFATADAAKAALKMILNV
jgi:hypothetical protein